MEKKKADTQVTDFIAQNSKEECNRDCVETNKAFLVTQIFNRIKHPRWWQMLAWELAAN